VPLPALRIADYFNRPPILSRPALAQASSSSPPGAPPTPIAPTASAPTLILIAPCNRRMWGSFAKPPADGVVPIRAEHQHRVGLIASGPSVVIDAPSPRNVACVMPSVSMMVAVTL